MPGLRRGRRILPPHNEASTAWSPSCAGPRAWGGRKGAGVVAATSEADGVRCDPSQSMIYFAPEGAGSRGGLGWPRCRRSHDRIGAVTARTLDTALPPLSLASTTSEGPDLQQGPGHHLLAQQQGGVDPGAGGPPWAAGRCARSPRHYGGEARIHTHLVRTGPAQPGAGHRRPDESDHGRKRSARAARHGHRHRELPQAGGAPLRVPSSRHRPSDVEAQQRIDQWSSTSLTAARRKCKQSASSKLLLGATALIDRRAQTTAKTTRR